MASKVSLILVTIALAILLAVMPVSALGIVEKNNTAINRTATIFIGEQGLNLTHALNQAAEKANINAGGIVDNAPTNFTVGWWASAAYVTETGPSKKVDLEPSYKAFTVDQLSFVGYTENWYLLGSDKSTPLVGTDGKPIVV
ncbi:DUF3821 domain-containing protein, partial [Methanoregula sp.]|uniref:DUF3821 domain-containing protein n=1 Tax=Methanoregula sp. TaxID=2052170 RepID=UPI0026380040